MAHTYPYPLAFFSDVLPYGEIQGPYLRRYDETSGSGDGRRWAAEKARPLWEANVTLPATRTAAEARAIESRIRALDGMARHFLFRPPQYLGPANGITAGLGSVTVNSIRQDRGAIGLAGLPGGFAITPGDLFTILYASGRVYMGEFSEGGTGTGQREIRPYLPMGISTGAAVILTTPYFKAFVEDFTPFTIKTGGTRQPYASDFTAYGASLVIKQKI